MHAFFCVSSFVLVYFLYPETKGVPLEEMDEVFGEEELQERLENESEAASPVVDEFGNFLADDATGHRGGSSDRLRGDDHTSGGGWLAQLLYRLHYTGARSYEPVPREGAQ